MLFWPWEASGLNLCYSLASLLFVVLYLQKPQGAFVHCYGLFQKPFPALLCLPGAGMLDVTWRQEVPLFFPWLGVHQSGYVFCRVLFMWLEDG